MKNPSPEEIRAACLEIQKTWDEETRISRIADPSRRPDYVHHWTVPVVSIKELGVEAESALQDVTDIGDDYSCVLADLIPFADKAPQFPRTGSNMDRVKLQ